MPGANVRRDGTGSPEPRERLRNTCEPVSEVHAQVAAGGVARGLLTGEPLERPGEIARGDVAVELDLHGMLRGELEPFDRRLREPVAGFLVEGDIGSLPIVRASASSVSSVPSNRNCTQPRAGSLVNRKVQPPSVR